jgi:hypothetical protein
MRLAVDRGNTADGLYQGVCVMVDLFAYDVVEALSQPGCPLCRALDEFEQADMATFLREAHRDVGTRQRFFASRGFCRRHARLLHRLTRERESIAPVARIYADLVERDLELFDGLETELAKGRTRDFERRFRRASPCPACESAEAALQRKTSFLVDALEAEAIRAGYRASDGLCYQHLDTAARLALVERPETATFLLADWRARLERLAHELGEYDRKRDHRYAHEPKGPEQHSWITAIRRYSGNEATQDRAS